MTLPRVYRLISRDVGKDILHILYPWVLVYIGNRILNIALNFNIFLCLNKVFV